MIGIINVLINMFIDKDHVNVRKNIISIGSEAAIVYIIIYILACTRSG